MREKSGNAKNFVRKGQLKYVGLVKVMQTLDYLSTTFEKSPNPPSVKMRLCKHGKGALYWFYTDPNNLLFSLDKLPIFASIAKTNCRKKVNPKKSDPQCVL